MSHRKPLTAEQIAHATKLVEGGATLRIAGAAVGCSSSHIRKVLIANGVPMRPVGITAGKYRRNGSKVDTVELIRLYRDKHLSVRAVAKQMGIHHATVTKTLTRLGVPRRPVGLMKYGDTPRGDKPLKSEPVPPVPAVPQAPKRSPFVLPDFLEE